MAEAASRLSENHNPGRRFRVLPYIWTFAAVFVLASGSVSVLLTLSDPEAPVSGDTPYYLALGQSLARDWSYRNSLSFWPSAVATDRMPGWPLAISLGLRALPHTNPNVVPRVVAGVLHVINSLLIAVLALRLTHRRRHAFAAGAFFAIYPVSLSLIKDGNSEHLFVTLALLGCLGILRGGGHLAWGALVLGLGCLVRPNYILIPAAMVLVLAVPWWHTAWRRTRFDSYWVALGLILFVLPPSLWIARNWLVSGGFPVISTLRGETFYGGNNATVANDLLSWGYWIMPDEIPGETTKRELSQKLSSLELDRYYFRKGQQFLQQNWFGLPRLLVGKLVRAYVPVPWKPNWGSYAVFSVRALLYVCILMTFSRWSRRCDPNYLSVFWAFVLVNLVTTVFFYGTYRFTFIIEPLTVPLVAVGYGGRKNGRLERQEVGCPDFAGVAG